MSRISEISQESVDDDSEEKRVKQLARSMLKSSVFVGTFQEKRLVGPLGAYRDVIKVSPEDSKVIKTLSVVKKRCANFFPRDTWIGITDPNTVGAPAGHNVWVSLDEEVFGTYIYKIRNVKFTRNEVCLKVEVIRAMSSDGPVDDISRSSGTLDLNDITLNTSIFFKEKLSHLFRDVITVPNLKSGSVFMFVLVSTVLTLLVQSVQYLLDYFLKILHESSGLIQACTPIFLGIMKVIMNTINGLYTLIAIMWTSRKQNNFQRQAQYQRAPYREHDGYYNGDNQHRALPAPGYFKTSPYSYSNNSDYYRQTATITPLD